MPSSPLLTWSYVQGLIFIFLVALIWAASSILVQYLYTDYSFNSPFLLTYIGSSLFTLWLPTKLVASRTCPHEHQQEEQCFVWWQRLVHWWTGGRHGTISDGASTTTRSTRYHGLDQSPPRRIVTSGMESQHQPREESPIAPTNAAPIERFQDEPSSSTAAPSRLPVSISESNDHLSNNNNGRRHCHQWSHDDHFRAALWIAPTWFMANWTYNASLASTSITSSTVLASTGSLFTFMFAVCSKDERFAWLKLAGVLLGVLGSSVTAWGDVSMTNDDETNDSPDDSDGSLRWLVTQQLGRFLRGSTSHVTDDNDHALWGDFLGLLSAVGYGGYAVQTRILCPHDESLYSMQLLLGYIGLTSLITLSPITLYLIIFQQVRPPWVVVGALMVKGLFDNVLSDYLWLRAVMLTNATVATVGLGMTIPLAFLSDVFWLHKPNVWNIWSVLGAVSVLSGFVFVNVGNAEPIDDDRNATNNRATTQNHDLRSENYNNDVGAEDGSEENRMQLRQLD